MIVDLLMKIAKESQPPMQAYYPRPSAWGRCIRASVYHALGYPPQLFAGRFIMLLEESGFTEDMTADWIRRSAWKVHSEQMAVEVADAFPWRRDMAARVCDVCSKQKGTTVTVLAQDCHGHIDGILGDLIGNDYLWENKGISHAGFEELEAALADGLFPERLDKWIRQQTMYLAGLAKHGVHGSILTVTNRNTSAKIEVVGAYDGRVDQFKILSALSTRIAERSETGIVGELRGGLAPMVTECAKQSFIDYFFRVDDFAKQKFLPPRPYDLNDWHCNYCQWQGTCWAGYEKEIEALAEGVEMPADLVPIVDEYKLCSEMESRSKKKKDELKSVLVHECEARGIKKCKSEPPLALSLSLSLQSRTDIVAELVPANIRKAAEKVSTFTKLDVRRLKGGK